MEKIDTQIFQFFKRFYKSTMKEEKEPFFPYLQNLRLKDATQFIGEVGAARLVCII